MMARSAQGERRDERNSGEEGFMLVYVIVLVAIVLILLAVAAPVIAKDLRRDKEIESQHRANEYVRAIQLYYRKNKSYPASIKALENTNNVRYLRHQWVDPLTGKADWKLIHLGEQKTKIHVFFGKDLGELSAGLGSAAGLASPGQAGVGAVGPTTVNSSNALNAGFGGSVIGGSSGSTGASGATGSTGFGGGAFGDGTGGIIVGVAPNKSGDSITNPNQQTTYDTWEFWYDPRIELLKQSVSITGGGVSSQSASSFGKDATSGQPSSTTGAFGATGATGGNGTPTAPTPPATNPFP